MNLWRWEFWDKLVAIYLIARYAAIPIGSDFARPYETHPIPKICISIILVAITMPIYFSKRWGFICQAIFQILGLGWLISIRQGGFQACMSIVISSYCFFRLWNKRQNVHLKVPTFRKN